MQLLERCMLRRENAIFALRYAMTSLKLNSLSVSCKQRNVSFRDGEFISQKSLQVNPSSHSIELENKELYLRYVEEVLTAKEQELVQLEEHLTLRKSKLDEQEADLRLSAPIALTQQAEIMARKVTALKEVAFKLASSRNQAAVVRELEEFQSGLAGIEESCRLKAEAVGVELQETLAELTAQRQELAARKSKLGELECYEKYLNQLQAVLQQKEYQVILRERELQQMSLAFCESNTQTLSLKHAQFNTYQEESNPDQSNADHSIRKRAKIFQPRTQSQQDLIQHKQSSKIMQENSTNDYTKQKISKGSEVEQPPIITTATGMQTASMDNQVAASCMRLQGERATVKFLRLWLKFSDKANRGGVTHQKTMNLYLWRLNTLFDEQSKRKIQKALCWPQRMNNIPDYKSLSIKKRRYYELFYDYERRLFHRQKTLVRLRAVLNNKNRRERTAVLLVFHRYRNNSRMMGLMELFKGAASTERVLSEKPSNPIMEVKPKAASRTDSRILGSSASNTENRLHSEHSKGKLNSKLTPTASASSKSRVLSREQAAIDIPKLKEYIKNQEETEVKLATECARTEAVFRMGTVLATNLSRLRTRFIVNTIRIGQTGKLNALEKAMSGCEFKWELFMAKARLALTTNSNKIAHLEQLVGFMDCK